MTDLHQEKFRELKSRVEAVFDNGILPAGLRQRLVRVVVMPQVGNWELFEAGVYREAPVHRIAHAVWRQPEDLEKFASPVKWLPHINGVSPQIEKAEGEIGEIDAGELWNEVSRIEVPLQFEGHLSVDGVRYALVIESYMSSMTLRWSNDPPDQWKQVRSLVDTVVEFMRNQFPMESNEPAAG